MNDVRVAGLQKAMIEAGLDLIAVVPGPNMFYLSGIQSHVSERPFLLFLPSHDAAAVVVPRLEAMKAEQAGIGSDRIFAWGDDEGYEAAFDQAASALNLDSSLLGVETLHMRVLELQILQQAAPGIRTAAAEPTLSSLRSVKDQAEIEAHSRAIRAAEQAIAKLTKRVRAGMTEKQVAALLLKELLDAGAETLAFEPIVASGPNGASPHAMPGDRKLQNGDLVVIDWGCYIDHYPSDITRTFAVGKIEAEFQRIHDVVRLANKAARAAVRPGMTGQELDRVARTVIEEAGYGDYFIHRTGHGLGLEVHETPDISSTNTRPLVVGNVFTIEPGIYLHDRAGVRIEDNIVVTEEGGRSLTSYSRELQTLG